jgi:hypothetical protein
MNIFVIDLKEEISTYTALSILPYLMRPNTLAKKKEQDDTTRKTWRPSRTEVKDGFITEINSAGDILKTVSDRKEKLKRLGHHLQPFIISVQRDGVICDYYVVVEDCKFLFKSARNAVDFCFKCIHALNVEYPTECRSLWFFIQRGFYNIKTPWDKEYVNVNSLMTDIGIAFKE